MIVGFEATTFKNELKRYIMEL